MSPENRKYQPLGAALDLMLCRAPEVLLEGPAGTGKTRAVLEKMHVICAMYPKARALLVRKTRASCTQTVLQIYEDHVVESGSPVLRGASRPVRSSYRYPNGSELVVGGLDNVDRIMSAEYDFIGVFEATEITENEWERLQTRLRNGRLVRDGQPPWHQIVAECNPQAPTHWLNIRGDGGKMVRLHSRHSDNPTCTEEYLALLSRLTGVRRDRLFLGRWAAAEGVVYPGFDRAIHLASPDVVRPDWRRIISVDFGYNAPFVAQWWAIDGDGRMYLYREIYKTGKLVSEHAADIRRLSADERIEAIVADHEDREGRETLHAAGLHTIPAEKQVLPGLQSVSARLQRAGDGKPRLYFIPGAVVELDPELRNAGRPTCTIEEFDSYIWEQERDGRLNKERPTKENDHGMDAMRYAVRYVDGGQAFRVRVITPSGRALHVADRN